jgi:hypothetical protein
MHDVLRARLLRKIESLPEDQIYQVLDYIEFLESKYTPDMTEEASGLQRFAERLEDRLRRRTVSPANIREAFQLIAAADRALSSVSQAGKQIMSDLGVIEGEEARKEPSEREGDRRPHGPAGEGESQG